MVDLVVVKLRGNKTRFLKAHYKSTNTATDGFSNMGFYGYYMTPFNAVFREGRLYNSHTLHFRASMSLMTTQTK